MTRLKNYIKEARSVIIEPNEATELINRWCMDAVNSNWLIYRGNSSITGNWYAVDPSAARERHSAYASGNQYNLLLSNLPSWKKYPKRSKSIIASTDWRGARGYAHDEPYILLPYDGASIGVCPKQDIWYSFKLFPMNETTGMEDFNIELGRLFHYLLGKSDRTYEDIKKHCDMVDDIVIYGKGLREEELHLYRDKQEYIQSYVEFKLGHSTTEWFTERIKYLGTGRHLWDILVEILDPDYNGFTMTTVGRGTISTKHEVWTDSKCIMVKASYEALSQLDEIGDILYNKMPVKSMKWES